MNNARCTKCTHGKPKHYCSLNGYANNGQRRQPAYYSGHRRTCLAFKSNQPELIGVNPWSDDAFFYPSFEAIFEKGAPVTGSYN